MHLCGDYAANVFKECPFMSIICPFMHLPISPWSTEDLGFDVDIFMLDSNACLLAFVGLVDCHRPSAGLQIEHDLTIAWARV
jgi:hypothetical protein